MGGACGGWEVSVGIGRCLWGMGGMLESGGPDLNEKGRPRLGWPEGPV